MTNNNNKETQLIFEEQIKKDLRLVFKDIDLNSYNDYGKRQLIFNYLINVMEYDYEVLNQIKDRRLYGNIKSVIDNHLIMKKTIVQHNGICNTIAYYYKILLEKLGIYSAVVVTHDGTEINHAINLVYDKENDTYSFDDITSVICNRGSEQDFFDYDLEDAKVLNQGNVLLESKEYFTIIDSEYSNWITGRDDILYKSFDIEKNNNFLNKIKSIKKVINKTNNMNI